MWANLCVGRPLCVAGIPCRPYPCAWHGLSAGIMRQRATLRPYMKQASGANGVAFGPIFV